MCVALCRSEISKLSVATHVAIVVFIIFMCVCVTGLAYC